MFFDPSSPYAISVASQFGISPFLPGASGLITRWHNNCAGTLVSIKQCSFIDAELFWRETRWGDYYNDHGLAGHRPSCCILLINYSEMSKPEKVGQNRNGADHHISCNDPCKKKVHPNIIFYLPIKCVKISKSCGYCNKIYAFFTIII